MNPGWTPTPPRPTSDWKTLFAGALVFTLGLIVAIILDLRPLALILVACVLPTAFVAGYLYRADLAARHRPSRLRFLRVVGDETFDSSRQSPAADP